MAHKTLPHIIHRQIFDLTLRPDAGKNDIQEDLKNAFLRSIPQLESVFSLYDDPDRMIRFDKIYLDLGVFKPDMIGDLFAPRLCDSLIKAFRDSIRSDDSKIFKNQKQDHETEPVDFRHLNTDMEASGLLFDTTIDNITSNKPVYYSPLESASMTFFYFLSNGVFPWWSGRIHEENLDSVFSTLLDSPSDSFIEELCRLLKNDNNALRRLLYQFPEKFIKKLLDILTQSVDQKITYLYKLIRQQVFRIKQLDPLEKYLKNRLFLQILVSKNTSDAVFKLTQFLKQIIAHNNSANEALIRMIRTDPWKPYLQEILKRLNDISEANLLITEDSTVLTDADQSPAEVSVDQKKELISDKNNDLDESVDEFLYIDYAGLVILHPFLAQFFKSLCLLDENSQFTDEKSRTKAIYLLAFLACGKMNSFEAELPFCKFLCGMPVRQSIAKYKAFHRDEIKECEQLLNAVISHWSVLKNTSIDGLRESFLTRKGKLDFREETTILFVETKPHDILLDMLPWGISFVQLPWMNKPFTTIWN